MPRSWVVLALISTCCVHEQAAAAQPHNHPVSARRQLSLCMTRHMSANRTMTYIEAAAVCKAQLRTERSTLAAAVPKEGGDWGK